MTPRDLEQLRGGIYARTTFEQQSWLEQAIERAEADPTAIRSLFPAVGRNVGRAPLDPRATPDDLHAWTLDDAARTLLLLALGDRAFDELELLYRYGDAAERRAVLRALALLPIGDRATVLVEDAIRTNDLRLIAAALGPYAFAHLSEDALAQAVLKCVFVGVPLGGLEGLEERTTAELSRMLASYAHERVAAGRDVPPEVWPLIDCHPPTEELAAILAELDHPTEERRQAARVALSSRQTVH